MKSTKIKDLDKLREQRLSGISLLKLAKMYNTTHSTIMYFCKKFNFTEKETAEINKKVKLLRTFKRTTNFKDLEKFKEQRLSGIPIRDLAKMYNVSSTTILNICEKFNFTKEQIANIHKITESIRVEKYSMTRATKREKAKTKKTQIEEKEMKEHNYPISPIRIQINKLNESSGYKNGLNKVSRIINKKRKLFYNNFKPAQEKISLPKKPSIIGGIYFLFQYRSIKAKLPFNSVKIGYSTDIFQRKKMISASNPETPLLLCFLPILSISLEKELHLLFIRSHKKDEWFYYTKEIEDFILKINSFNSKEENIKEYLDSIGLRYKEKKLITRKETEGEKREEAKYITRSEIREKTGMSGSHLLKLLKKCNISPVNSMFHNKLLYLESDVQKHCNFDINKKQLTRLEMMNKTKLSRTHLIRLLEKYKISPVESFFQQKLVYSKSDFEKLIKLHSEYNKENISL